MNAPKNIFRIRPERKKLIAKAGKWGLYESVFTMENMYTESGSENLVYVVQKNLIPAHSESEYISIDDAHNRSGISKIKLNELCAKGIIDAKMVEGKWLILLESLDGYSDRS